MNLFILKLEATIFLACLTFAFGLFPLIVKIHLKKIFGSNILRISDKIVPFLLYFTAGVLFSTCLIHMIPEITDAFSKIRNDFISNDFPFIEMIISCGFFFIYILEEIIHYCSCSHSSHIHHKRDQRNLLFCTTNYDCTEMNSETACCSYNEDVPLLTPVRTKSMSHVICESEESVEECIPSLYGAATIVCDATTSRKVSGLTETRSQPVSSYRNVNTHVTSVRSAILVLALSFHSVFEGIAVGLQSTTSAMWNLFVGITSHKLVLAFCVGWELLFAYSSHIIFVVHMFIFSLVSPFGILIGHILTSGNPVTHLSVIIFQSITAGTLLYITFFNVLQQESLKVKSPVGAMGIIKSLFVILGFFFMTLLKVFDKHESSRYQFDNASFILTSQ